MTANELEYENIFVLVNGRIVLRFSVFVWHSAVLTSGRLLGCFGFRLCSALHI